MPPSRGATRAASAPSAVVRPPSSSTWKRRKPPSGCRTTRNAPFPSRQRSTAQSRANAVEPLRAHSTRFSSSGGVPVASCVQAASIISAAALNVRIDVRLGGAAGMGHRAAIGRADVLRIAPPRPRLIVVLPRAPTAVPLLEDRGFDLEFDGPGLGIDRDNVAVLDQRDGPTVGGL